MDKRNKEGGIGSDETADSNAVSCLLCVRAGTNRPPEQRKAKRLRRNERRGERPRPAKRVRRNAPHAPADIVLINGALFKAQWSDKGSAHAELLPVIPRHLQPVIVRLYHSSSVRMHAGITRTLGILRKRFAWRKMRDTVVAVIAACLPCQRVKAALAQKGAPLLPLPREGPWHTVGMDLFGPLPTTVARNKFVLVIVDHFTKWPIAVPLRTTTAAVVIDQLFLLINEHGCPCRLLTDRGPQFMDKTVRALCAKLGTEKVFTTAYYPQGDGIAEAFMKVLKHNLAILMEDDPHNWDRALPQLLFAYRNTPHPSTGDTPFRLLYGYDARWPSDVVLHELTQPHTPRTVIHDLLELRMKSLRNARRIAFNTMAKCFERAQARRAEALQPKATSYKKGQLVWVKTSDFERRRTNAPKMAPKFTGPYRILGVHSNAKTYRVAHIVTGRETSVNFESTKPVVVLSDRDLADATVELKTLPRAPDEP